MRRRFLNLHHVIAAVFSTWVFSLVCATSLLLPSHPARAGSAAFKCDQIEDKSRLTSIGVKIYQGDDGWFFRQGDMENIYELSPDAIASLKKVSAALDYRGTRLILMPMLPRGIAGQAFIPQGGVFSDMIYDAGFSTEQFRGMIRSLQAEGLDTVDIPEILALHPDFDQKTYYLKRDIHWTPEGARIVAKAVAEKIRSIQPADEKAVDFKTEKSGKAVVYTVMTTVLNELCQEPVPTEFVNIYNTRQAVDSLDALFSEDEASSRDLVHVVGTSFTDERLDFNFNGFFREFLQQDVAGFSIAGGGLTQSIYGWTQNEAGLNRRPRFLVWEYSDLKALMQSTTYISNAVVPAIVGDCDAGLKISETRYGEGENFAFELPALSGDPSDYYLRYTFTNAALTRFQLAYAYEDGSSKLVSFENPSRVTGLTKLYQNLPAEPGQRPIRVNLQLANGVKSAGSVKLCRYPDGLFNAPPKSN